MIASQHRSFKVGGAFIPREQKNATRVVVRGTFKPELSVLEKDPILMVYCSADTQRERQLQFFEMSGGTFEANFFLAEKTVEVDDAIHFQVFARVFVDDIYHFMPAGDAAIYLAEVEAGEEKTLALELVSVKYNREEGIVKKKGTIAVSGSVSSPLIYSPVDQFLLVEKNQKALDRLAAAEAVKFNSVLRSYSDPSGDFRLEPYQPELRNIRCLFYDTPVGRAPGAAYFFMLDMPPAELSALKYLLKAAMRRHDISEEAFIQAARTLHEGGPLLSYAEYLALDTAAEGLTLLPNSIPYLSDLAATGGGMWTRATLQIVELFDDALRRLTGDCEDFTKLIGWIFRSVCASAGNGDPLLDAWADILKQYVPCASLLSVLGSKKGDGGDIKGIPRIDDPALFNRVGAHMACFLLSKQYFAESMGVDVLPAGVMGDALSDYAPRPGAMKKYHTLTLEGTGQMCSMLDTYDAYMKDGASLYHDYQLLNARFYEPDMEDKPSKEYVSVPLSMMRWEERSITQSDKLSDMSIPNNFYRIVVWFCVMGAAVPLVAGNSVRNIIPLTDSHYGVPIMHLVRRKRMTLLATPDYGSATEKYMRRLKRHLAPAAPVCRPENIVFTAEIQEAFKRFSAAGASAMADRVKTNNPTRTLVRTRKLSAALEEKEIQEFWKFVKKNPYVEGVDVWLEHVYDGLANLCVGIKIHS